MRCEICGQNDCCGADMVSKDDLSKLVERWEKLRENGCSDMSQMLSEFKRLAERGE